MNRRDAIKQTALLMGYAVSASAVMGVMNGCKADPKEVGWQPVFFDQDQIQLVAEMAEEILPATDTPGAKDVLVHRFMDKILHESYQAPVKQRFLEGLNAFAQDCQSTFQKNFIDCSPEERKQLLSKYDQAAFEAKDQIEKEEDDEKEMFLRQGEKLQVGEGYIRANRAPFFTMFKELTLLGYFTSDKIGTEIFNYDPIPGNYDGCIDLPENGRAWSY